MLCHIACLYGPKKKKELSEHLGVLAKLTKG